MAAITVPSRPNHAPSRGATSSRGPLDRSKSSWRRTRSSLRSRTNRSSTFSPASCACSCVSPCADSPSGRLADVCCLFLWADLEGETQGEHQEMTLQLEAYDTIMEGKNRLGPPFNLRLSLGMTPRDALSTLATAVENWRQCFGFLVSNLWVPPGHVNPVSGALILSRACQQPCDANPVRGLRTHPSFAGQHHARLLDEHESPTYARCYCRRRDSCFWRSNRTGRRRDRPLAASAGPDFAAFQRSFGAVPLPQSVARTARMGCWVRLGIQTTKPEARRTDARLSAVSGFDFL